MGYDKEINFSKRLFLFGCQDRRLAAGDEWRTGTIDKTLSPSSTFISSFVCYAK